MSQFRDDVKTDQPDVMEVWDFENEWSQGLCSFCSNCGACKS
jgi:hypothetical protein